MVQGEEPLIDKGGAAAPSAGPFPARCGGRCMNPLYQRWNKIECGHCKGFPCGKVFALILFFGFWWTLFRGIMQFFMFHYATMGCSAAALEDYHYPGGGWTCPPDVLNPSQEFSHWPAYMARGCSANPSDNAVPGSSILRERGTSAYGHQFEVYHVTHGTATISGAAVGTWWRTWGPWFWTYTYEDMGQSKTTLYMRPTIMGMMGLYSETRIMRCDGANDVWFFGEGSNWVSNRIRTLFGMQRESSFKLYKGSDQVGKALETFHDTKSVTFFNTETDPDNPVRLGSGVLRDEGATSSDQWVMEIAGSALSDDTDITKVPPYYVLSAAITLMGFRWVSIRHGNGVFGHGPTTPPPSFLAETSDASVPYFEETDDVAIDQQTEALKGGEETADAEPNEAVREETDA